MIRARELRKSYQDGDVEVKVLDGLNLDVAPGEFVAVVGPSGSGKSTLLHVLGGLDETYSGEIEVDGVKVGTLGDADLAHFRNTKIGFVFQSFHLVPNLSALENVVLPGFFAGAAPGAAERTRAQEALERVGLGAKTDRLPGRLSGGERQRVAIARALFSRPRVLLCDEPTGNLDAFTGAEVISLFHSLHKEGLTLLAVTHEERMSSAAQRVLRLKGGQLIPEPGGKP